MTTSNVQTTRKPVFETTGFAPVSYLTKAFKRLVVWQRVYGATMQELSHLSDRELADINISRTDLKQIATEAANEAINA